MLAIIGEQSPSNKQLSIKLNLSIIPSIDQAKQAKFEYGLILSEGLKLINLKNKSLIDINFDSYNLKRRVKLINQEALIKAIGNKNKLLNIIDATAGFAQDSFLIANCNHQVIMIEKSKIIAELIINGLRQAKKSPIIAKVINNMQLINGDATELIPKIKAEIIYLDPMFNKSNKNALANKNMEFLKFLIKPASDKEIGNLLNLSLQYATDRVIIKRPQKSAYLTNTKPTFILNGIACRFEVYQLSKKV